MNVDKMFDVVQPKETDKIGDDGKPVTRWQNLGIAFEKEGKITGIKLCEALRRQFGFDAISASVAKTKSSVSVLYAAFVDGIVAVFDGKYLVTHDILAFSLEPSPGISCLTPAGISFVTNILLPST